MIPFRISLLALAAIAFSSCSERPPAFSEETALDKRLSGEKAFAHVKALVDFGPRPAGSDALAASRSYLVEQLAAFGWETQEQTFTKKTFEGEIEFTNLVARFGHDRWNEPIVGLLCSHYDTKLYENFDFVGANDGGSSTGLLLEIARVLAEKPALAEKIELVFFDGEEAFGPNITQRDGLYGSRYYAAEWTLKESSLRPKWGILLDMVGDRDLRIRAGVQIPGEPLAELARSGKGGYRVDVEAVKEGLAELSRKLLGAAEDLGVRDQVGISPDYILDDHIPLNVTAGIPTIDLIDFDYPYWHTPGDTLDKVSPDSLEVSGQVTLRLVEKYLLGEGFR